MPVRHLGSRRVALCSAVRTRGWALCSLAPTCCAAQHAGAATMRNHEVIFDRAAHRVAFVPADCKRMWEGTLSSHLIGCYSSVKSGPTPACRAQRFGLPCPEARRPPTHAGGRASCSDASPGASKPARRHYHDAASPLSRHWVLVIRKSRRLRPCGVRQSHGHDLVQAACLEGPWSEGQG